MEYLVPFSAVRKTADVKSIDERRKLGLDTQTFIGIVKMFLQSVEVDEEWYRRNYPDVDEAIRKGEHKSAKQHFVENGYFEGRHPFSFDVNEQWYLTNYPDVALQIRDGSFSSAKAHFFEHGYEEGRLPAPPYK